MVVEDAEIQFIPKQIFLQLLKEDISFTNAVLEILCDHLDHSHNKISDLVGMDGKQRFAALLLSLEMAFDEDGDYENSLIRLQKKDMAAAIGVAPETVSRYISEFRKKRLIQTSGDAIEVLNRVALLRLSKVND